MDIQGIVSTHVETVVLMSRESKKGLKTPGNKGISTILAIKCRINPTAAWHCWQQIKKTVGLRILISFHRVENTVCGHWHCSFGHANYEGDGGEFDNNPNFSPYCGTGFIALDACTPVSHKVNCMVIEDWLRIFQKQNAQKLRRWGCRKIGLSVGAANLSRATWYTPVQGHSIQFTVC